MSRFHHVTGAVIAGILILPLAAPVAQAHVTRHHHTHHDRPRVNDNGAVCRMKPVRKCATYRGRTYCKPTYERVCRQVGADR